MDFYKIAFCPIIELLTLKIIDLKLKKAMTK